MCKNIINDGFGDRIHPITGVKAHHNGVDYTTCTGVPITTNIPMTVVGAGVQNGYGKIVTLRDDSGNTYKYAHLDEMTVKPGQRIPPDTLIGYVGSTGKSTGSHLHFEAANAAGVSKDPNTINPATGRLWSDVSGFKKGQTLNESIKNAAPDKNRYNRPSTPQPDSTINDAVKKAAEKEAARKRLKELKEQQDRKNQQTGPSSTTRQRPSTGNTGVLVNPLTNTGDGSK